MKHVARKKVLKISRFVLSGKHWMDRLIKVNGHQRTVEGVSIMYLHTNKLDSVEYSMEEPACIFYRKFT